LITFLPNSRASIEYAPGPSATVAAAVNADIPSCNRFEASDVTTSTSSSKHDNAAQYGVKSPTNKHNATTAATTSTTNPELGAQHFTVLINTVTPTIDRKTTKAIPALPEGNIVNSLCTQAKVTGGVLPR
jgi:hypothetical protein